MAFVYERIVHFRDTDAAGVVYFANVLNMCHEAYEASLAATGIDLQTFFGGAEVAVPIVHAEVDFFRPLFCGDRVQINLAPQQLTPHRFEIVYQIAVIKTGSATAEMVGQPRSSSQALTRHVCIDAITRQKITLPPLLIHWIEAWRSQTADAPSKGSNTATG